MAPNWSLGCPGKTNKQGVENMEFPAVIREIACGISRGSLKMKWNFQGWPRKNNVEFPGVLDFGFGISTGSNKNLWTFQGGAFCLEFPWGKVKKWKIPGTGSKKYAFNPPFGFFLE